MIGDGRGQLAARISYRRYTSATCLVWREQTEWMSGCLVSCHCCDPCRATHSRRFPRHFLNCNFPQEMKEKTARTWTPRLGREVPDVLLPDIREHPTVTVSRTQCRSKFPQFKDVAGMPRYTPTPPQKGPFAPVLPPLCHCVAGKVPRKNGSRYTGV